jgi:hypothetical protein
MALLNFVQDDDLKKLYPSLTNQLWSTQTDFSPQISKAFDILLDDLHNMQIKPERVMIPVDLRNDSDNKNLPAQYATNVSVVTGSAFPCYYERRVVASVQTINGSWILFVDGNSSVTIPSATDTGWENATIVPISASYANSRVTTVVDRTYNWMRYRLSPVTSGSICASVVAYTTIFDDCIVYKALSLIFRAFAQKFNNADDNWYGQWQSVEEDYKNALMSAKFVYDSNQDGVVDTDETDTKMWDIRLVR